jgi:FAD binding domain
MPDWFLRTHGVPGSPLCFDMGGLWAIVSIRDQMLRAQELVRRLARAGALSSTRPLLVIGAGAAGATAALEAARRGIGCRVIDSAASPFGPQARCHTRWVDPTQYDWPMPHWDAGQFPWPRSWSPHLPVTRVPLPWQAAPAAHLALAWHARLNAARAAGLISTDYGARFTGATLSPAGPRTPATLVEAETQTGTGPMTKHGYGAIIAATGMGHERVTAGAYHSWQFWENDTLEAANCGLPRTTTPSVLISGAGDGALQDFVRVVTGQRSAAAIWDALIAGGATTPFDIFAELLAAEDHLKCAYACADVADEHHVLQEVHDRTIAAAIRWHRLHQVAIANVLDVMLAARPDVSLVHPCTHFGKTYMLNRFLVHVLADYLDSSHGRTALRSSVAVCDVRGVEHTCAGPGGCLGQGHDVDIVALPRCGSTPGTTILTTLTHNVVVLRHGINPATAVFGSRPSGPFKQPLPQYPQP